MALTHQNFQFLYFFVVFILGKWASLTLSYPLDHYKAMSMRDRHEQWMAQHRRVYKDSMEKEKRYSIFKENVEYVENFNANKSSNKLFTLGVNVFADLKTEEFISTRTGYKPSQFTSNSRVIEFKNNNTDVPLSIDWRDYGAVTPVKDQRVCGSAWAFAVVAAVEGINKIKTGKLTSLSEQELIDCIVPIDIEGGGCNGGDMAAAYSFIQQNQGLLTETDYPYQAMQGNCLVTALGRGVGTITGYEQIGVRDENTLMQLVSQQPVSMSISVSFSIRGLMYYSSGIFNDECGPENHAVTIIGYGTDTSGSELTDYWLVKNSWGDAWGEDGYVKIIRGTNQCGFLSNTMYRPLY